MKTHFIIDEKAPESRVLMQKALFRGAGRSHLKTLTNWITECDKILKY
jgi:hypothetical protein